MAHFAELDENNIVLRVIVVNNADCLKGDVEDEITGIAYCVNLLGGKWIKTSYNSTIRKNFASPGYTYDEGRDAFISPKPYPSWILNESTCRWEAPVSFPQDGKMYRWHESTQNWIEA